MFKKNNEEVLRQSICKEIHRVQQDILADSITWHPEKLAIIRDCFEIAGKIASGYETKKIKF